MVKAARHNSSVAQNTYLIPQAAAEALRACVLRTHVRPVEALARLEQQGKLTAVITQNIDGLHQRAGSKTVLELHGSVYRNHCMRCGRAYPVEAVVATAGVPRCDCGGIIKPDVVLYGEGLDSKILSDAVAHIASADMLLIGGTQLSVYPAAGLVDYFRGRDIAVINLSETSRETGAALTIRRPIGEVLSEVVP